MVENGNRQGNSGCGFVAIVAVVAVLLVLGACALFLRFDWLGAGSVFLQRSTPVTPTPTLPAVVAKAGQKPLPSATFAPTGTPAPSVLPAAKTTVPLTSTLVVPTSTPLPTKTIAMPLTGRAPVSEASGQERSLALPPFKEVIAVYDPFRRVNLMSGVKIDFYKRASVESTVVFSVGPLPYPQPILVDALVKGFNGTLFYEQCFYDEASRECEPQAYFLAIYGRVVVPTPTPTAVPWDFSVAWREIDSGDRDRQEFERVIRFVPSDFLPTYVAGPKKIRATLCSSPASWSVAVYKWNSGWNVEQKEKSGLLAINCPEPPYYSVLRGYPLYPGSFLQPLTDGVNLRTKPFVTKATQKYVVGPSELLKPLRLVEADDFGKGNPYWWQVERDGEVLYVHWSVVIEKTGVATPTPTPVPVLTPTPTSEIIAQPGDPPCAYRLDPPLQLCVTYKGGYRDEWVMIRNLSGFIGFGSEHNISLANYQLTDFDGNVFNFTGSSTVVLGPGKIVYVVTDETQNGVFRGMTCSNCYSWHAQLVEQLKREVPRVEFWEDRGDVARLKNAQGQVVLEVRYGLGQTPNMLQQERQKRSVK